MLEFITNNWPTFINILTLVVSLAAAIAALTPTPKDDNVLAVIRKVVDFLALNVGNAKNRGLDVNKSSAKDVMRKTRK